jgi:hypothetical protein
MCVLSMHSSRGRLRTMCGSRTGGWSLPGVMSDWQCYVDWFLAKYCRCRLRLAWCWCKWRTSAKGRCQWGLEVWRRQVGLVRGTRWPVGSCTGRMVARTTWWSRGRFLGWAKNQGQARTSWDPSHEWWLAEATSSSRVCGGSPENHRVTRRNHKAEAKDRAWLPGQNGPDQFGEPVWPVWRRKAPEASRRRTHIEIIMLASRLCEVRSPGVRPMVLQRQIPKVPLVGVYPSLGFRGNLFFWLASI